MTIVVWNGKEIWLMIINSKTQKLNWTLSWAVFLPLFHPASNKNSATWALLASTCAASLSALCMISAQPLSHSWSFSTSQSWAWSSCFEPPDLLPSLTLALISIFETPLLCKYSNYFFKSELFSLMLPVLLTVMSCGVWAKSVNKTPRTGFGVFVSSLESVSEEHLNITGASYQLCQKNDWVTTTTAIPVAVQHQERISVCPRFVLH